MNPVRVAVQIGAGSPRVAVAEGPTSGGGPPLVVELPAPSGPVDLPALVAGVVGPGPVPTVFVHPAGWTTRQVGAWTWGPAVPAPVAAAGGGGRRLVLDVGGSGSEVALVDHGRVVVHRRCAVGGRRLDEVVAGLIGADRDRARRVREALSLLPTAGGIDAEQLRVAVTPLLGEVVAMLAAVQEVSGPAPVLLIGGLARYPLLAELIDETGPEDLVVAPCPESAAVRGALARAPARQVTPADPGPVLPPPPPRTGRPVRRVLGAVAAAGSAAALLGAGTLLRPSPSAPVATVPAGVLVQYGYRFAVPAGWEHIGGLPVRRRTLLTPAVAPEGSDLIAVERTPLGYDVGAEPQRAAAELRATFGDAVAAGDPLSGYGTTSVRGRSVTTYRQRDAGVVVEWFVVLDGDAQLSVGCRHTTSGEAAVRAACDVVVGSVRRE